MKKKINIYFNNVVKKNLFIYLFVGNNNGLDDTVKAVYTFERVLIKPKNRLWFEMV